MGNKQNRYDHRQYLSSLFEFLQPNDGLPELEAYLRANPKEILPVAHKLANVTINKTAQIALVDLGGSRLLKLFLASPLDNVKHCAVHTVSNLASNPHNQGKMAADGWVDILLGLVSSKTNQKVLQTKAARALANLAVNDDNKKLIARKGGIGAFISMLKANEDEDTVLEALAVLANLAVDDGVELAIGRQNGIEPVVERLQSSHEGVVHQAKRAVNNLRSHPENRKKVDDLMAAKLTAAQIESRHAVAPPDLGDVFEIEDFPPFPASSMPQDGERRLTPPSPDVGATVAPPVIPPPRVPPSMSPPLPEDVHPPLPNIQPPALPLDAFPGPEILGGGNGMAEDAISMLSQVEAETFNALNLARQNPRKMASLIEERLNYLGEDKIFRFPWGNVETVEGRVAFVEAIKFLSSRDPLSGFSLSRGMTNAAQRHVNDIGPAGSVGHVGSDGRRASARANAFGSLKGAFGEAIEFGPWQHGSDFVIGLIVDDGRASRDHRGLLFNPKIQVCGVGVGNHKKFGKACVMMLAHQFAENDV